MSIWQMVTWDVARAGGFTAFGLLTLSVAIGLALTLHIQSPRWPRIINSELHNFITLLALIFTGVHILAVWIDPFTNFGWNEVFIPFASHYRPLWMALGIIAFYTGIAIGISTWLRPHIGYKLWRRLHVLTLLLYALVVVHGIATGSDTRTEWGAAIYAISVLLIGILLIIRLMKPATAKDRAHPVLAVLVVVVIVVATFLCMLGPFQPGWNAIANNGNGSGGPSTARAAISQQAATTLQTAFPQSFTGDLQGHYTENGPGVNGNVTLQLDLSIHNGPSGNVKMILQGQGRFGDDGSESISITSSRVTLVSSTGQQLYTGSLTNLNGDKQWHMTALLTGTGTNSGSQLQAQIDVQFNANGQAVGTIKAGSAISAGSGIEH
jgi:DMSO/TMAO reductase YedYZ heme-binding membrane subunit